MEFSKESWTAEDPGVLEGHEDRPQNAPKNTGMLVEAEKFTQDANRSLLAKRAIQTFLAILELAGVEPAKSKFLSW
jgi:hypothetical protein